MPAPVTTEFLILRDLTPAEVASAIIETRNVFARLKELSPQQQEKEHVEENDGEKGVVVTRQQRLHFVSVMLEEPDKEEMFAYEDALDAKMAINAPIDEPVPKRCAAVTAAVVDLANGKAAPFEVVLRRTNDDVLSENPQFVLVSWRTVPGLQPPVMEHEYILCENLTKTSPEVRAALRRRGMNDEQIDKFVMADPWVSFFSNPERRVVRPLLFYGDYCRPIDGIDIVVDMVKGSVESVNELFYAPIPLMDPQTGEPIDEPESAWRHLADNNPNKAEYAEVNRSLLRKDLKPLQVIQPEGVSFDLSPELRMVTWQKWRFHIGFNAREGIVLRNICYFDDGQPAIWRRIMWRASINEMVVPYGDPRYPNFLKNAFDAGEDGLGRNANSLELGCDCLGVIQYLDGVLSDEKGEVITIKNAICVHEEDYGLMMKHTDWRSGERITRRHRRLVVSFFTTVANYDYGFFWYFYMDGTITCEAKLTGQLSTSVMTDGQRAGTVGRYAPQPAANRPTRSDLGFEPTHDTPVDGFGTILNANDGLYAPIHQHFFCARLDWAVDGVRNSVSELNVKPVPPGTRYPGSTSENPNWHKAAFRASATPLTTELRARRHISAATARTWTVSNPHVRNRTGKPVAWKLVPGLNSNAMQDPSSVVAARAGFTQNHLWVTPFTPDELFCSGDYPMQRLRADNLLKWTEQNRGIADRDIVMWYVFGVTHMPRLEDWPVMPVEYASFSLQPYGFFDCNPAMDAPRSSQSLTHSREAKNCCENEKEDQSAAKAKL